ncbi:hypothetical protein FM036_46295 [Nostoc sp. HG1]|nr:hypothetical protein [Nostoc sp. HG1]
MYDGIVGDRLAENLKNNAIACCRRVSDVYDGLRLRLAETLNNKPIACCGRKVRSPFRKSQKQSDVYAGLYLCISHIPKSDRLAENLKNKAIAVV